MSKETIATLTDKDAIAVNQDPLGIQAYLYQQKDSVDTWIKPLANNEVAICFMNRSKKPVVVNYDFNNSPIIDTVSKTTINFNLNTFTINDLWAKKTIGKTTESFKGTVLPHDVIMLKLSNKIPIKK
jgi:alpha-galactosidase